jgi:hypothetical protein
MTSTRRAFFVRTLAVAISSFALEARSQPAKREVRLRINAFTAKTNTLVWTAYAVALAAWTSENLDNSKVPEGVFQPSFLAETAARQRQLKIWGELVEKELKTNAYIEAVARASNAGFLKEYVWSFHSRSDWGDPPTDLRLRAFEEWRLANLQDHKPMTGAYLSFGPKVAQ